MVDAQWMRVALAEAEAAMVRGDPAFGAAVVSSDGKTVVSAGSTEMSTGDPTRHDAINVIGLACVHLNRSTLTEYTYYGTAEPCLMCSAALLQVGVGRIVLGATGDELADVLGPRTLHLEELSIDYPSSTTVERGILRAEALAVLKRSCRAACLETDPTPHRAGGTGPQ